MLRIAKLQLTRTPQHRALCEEVWRLRLDAERPRIPGPVLFLRREDVKIGGTWDSPFVLRRLTRHLF